MIKIENVTFSYPGSNETVLSNLDLTIKDGEFLCVIGSGILPHATQEGQASPSFKDVPPSFA